MRKFYKIINLRLPKNVARYLEKYSEKQGCSVNYAIIELIRKSENYQVYEKGKFLPNTTKKFFFVVGKSMTFRMPMDIYNFLTKQQAGNNKAGMKYSLNFQIVVLILESQKIKI